MLADVCRTQHGPSGNVIDLGTSIAAQCLTVSGRVIATTSTVLATPYIYKGDATPVATFPALLRRQAEPKEQVILADNGASSDEIGPAAQATNAEVNVVSRTGENVGILTPAGGDLFGEPAPGAETVKTTTTKPIPDSGGGSPITVTSVSTVTRESAQVPAASPSPAVTVTIPAPSNPAPTVETTNSPVEPSESPPASASAPATAGNPAPSNSVLVSSPPAGNPAPVTSCPATASALSLFSGGTTYTGTYVVSVLTCAEGGTPQASVSGGAAASSTIPSAVTATNRGSVIAVSNRFCMLLAAGWCLVGAVSR